MNLTTVRSIPSARPRKPGLPPALAVALATPGFLQICAGNAITHLGLRLPGVVIAWLVLDMTGSKASMSLVNGVPAFAVVCFSLAGGVLADSRRARRALVVTRASLVLIWLTAGILVSTDQAELYHLFLIVLASVAATAVDMPIGKTLLFQVVGRERLLSATAMSAMAFNVLGIVAPIGLGLLIGLLGTGAALYALAGGYAVSFLLLLSTRVGETTATTPPKDVRRELREGLAYVRADRVVGSLASLAFLVPLAGVFFAMVPLYVRETLGLGAGSLGLLLGIYGAGSLTGSTFLALRGSVRHRGLFLASLGFVFGGGMIVFAVVHVYAIACLVAFGLGMTAMLWQNTLSTLVQTQAAPAMRGRVMSIYTMGLQLVNLGWLAGGLFATVAGIEAALVTAGVAFVGLNAFVFSRCRGLIEID
jgi:MFS family permease